MKSAVTIVLGVIALAVIMGATWKMYKKYKGQGDESNSK